MTDRQTSDKQTNKHPGMTIRLTLCERDATDDTLYQRRDRLYGRPKMITWYSRRRRSRRVPRDAVDAVFSQTGVYISSNNITVWSVLKAMALLFADVRCVVANVY